MEDMLCLPTDLYQRFLPTDIVNVPDLSRFNLDAPPIEELRARDEQQQRKQQPGGARGNDARRPGRAPPPSPQASSRAPPEKKGAGDDEESFQIIAPHQALPERVSATQRGTLHCKGFLSVCPILWRLFR